MRYTLDSMLPLDAFKPIGGKMSLHGGGSAPPPPDYTPIAEANSEAAAAAKETAAADLAFRTQVYNDSKPYQQQLMDMTNKVGEQQYQAGVDAQGRSTQQWDDYINTYQPLEHQMVQEAQNYGSDADQAQQAGMASNAVQAQIGNQRAQTARNMTAMGVNPNSARFAAIQSENDLAGAGMAAGAGTQARMAVRDKGIGLRAGAAAFGRNMPNTAGQMAGLSNQSGSGAVGSMNTGFQSGLPYAQFAAGGYNSGMQAASIQQQGALGMGGLMNQNYATAYNNVAPDQTGQYVGAGLGAAATIGAAVII